jgi:hypothetical protein
VCLVQVHVTCIATGALGAGAEAGALRALCDVWADAAGEHAAALAARVQSARAAVAIDVDVWGAEVPPAGPDAAPRLRSKMCTHKDSRRDSPPRPTRT